MLIRRYMTISLAVGSLVLFLAALVLALGGRPGSGRRDDSPRAGATGEPEGRDEEDRGSINLVRGKDFFERAKRPEDT